MRLVTVFIHSVRVALAGADLLWKKKYCGWLADGWFGMREKYYWHGADLGWPATFLGLFAHKICFCAV